MELNSGLDEREEEAHLLTGQVREYISKDSDFFSPKRSAQTVSNYRWRICFKRF